MEESIILGLVLNAAILLTFSLLYDFIWEKEPFFLRVINKAVIGIIIGGIGIVLMLTPWDFVPGIRFDTRSILLLVTGLFFGPIPTYTAMLITGAFRLFQGGHGAWMGIGTIMIAGFIGISWKHWRPYWKEKNPSYEVLKAAILVHIGMIACILLLPSELRLLTLKKIIIPALTIYPIGAVLLSKVLLNRLLNRKTREALKVNEERYYSFINSNSDIIFIKDDRLKYLIVNDSLCKFFKTSRKEITNKSDEELNGLVFNIKLSRDSDEKVLKDGVVFTHEEIIGEKIYEVKKFPLSLIDKKIGIGGIIRDITDRYKKRTLQVALLEISKISYQDLELQSFLAQVHMHINTVVSADNIYIALYHKECDMYSFPYYIDEYDKYESSDLIELHHSLTEIVRTTGKGMLITKEMEDEIRKESNIIIYGEYSPIWLGVPLWDSSFKEVIGVLAIQDYHNISAYNHEDLFLLEIFANNIGLYIERIENVNSLKAAKEKAEESDRLKTAFLANISHEFRTPMNAIIGFNNILKDEVKDEMLLEYIEIISKSSDRLLSTINDVIDIAKIEAGQVTIYREEFDLYALFQELLLSFKSQNLTIELRMVPISSDKLSIYSDKDKISHIMSNLLSNAIKFTKNGYVEFGYTLENSDTILLYVKDTGIGIQKENQISIFERFVQVEIGSKRQFEGTGLGLSISKVYSELLGGKIWLKSEPYSGSEFFVQLPYSAKALDDLPSKEETNFENDLKFPTMENTILIAEDDQNNFFYLKVLLKNLNSNLLHAHNGIEAVELCKSHPEINLVLMDIKMPEMDGLEATRLIKSFRPELPVIAQTAYALASDRERVLNAGCNDYISKPIKRDDLMNLLKLYI